MYDGDADMKERITIAIPTYNRVAELKTLLQAIQKQLSDVTPGFVAVRVSDNASTDNTMGLVESLRTEFSRLGSRLDYVRNAENVGFSRNVHRAVAGSCGEWVVIMGDDDSFETGTLAYLERILSDHPEIDALLLRSSRYDSNLLSVIEPLKDGSDRIDFFPDGSDYIRKFRSFPPALVSGYCIRRLSWVSARAEEFAYSISIHMLTLTRMMVNRATVAVSNRPSVKYRSDQQNSSWPQDPLYPFRFWLDALLASKMLRRDSDSDIFCLLSESSCRVLAYYVIRQKVLRHRFDKKLFDDFYRRAKSGFNRYSLIIFVMNFMPSWLARLVFKGLVERTECHTVD